MQLFGIESGFQSGVYNMALDEALLEWVRLESQPTLIVRTYQWEVPTLSLGVNQAVRDIQTLLAVYGKNQQVQNIVRRPTGGRAILHGEDISFSFITNNPSVLKQSLNDSYQTFSELIQQTLQSLNIAVQQSHQAQGKDYLRSPVCFETLTPSDLLADNGQKLAGSAQLRRFGGLLQHGAAFLNAYDIAAECFSRQLFETTAAYAQSCLNPFPLELIQVQHEQLQTAYLNASTEIWASASTTSGSHLVPASC
jgi:lipoate-protein ligase A